jgi:thiol-disulfide isomerase/thioredoxin
VKFLKIFLIFILGVSPAWALNLTPVTAVDVIKVVNSKKTKATLVNLWATWCDPCKIEFPEILKIQKKYAKDLSVIFISMDFDSQKSEVLKFLKDNDVTFETYIKHQSDMEFINGLFPKWEGALPTTGIYDRHHKLVQFWQGDADYDKFKKEVLKIIK